MLSLSARAKALFLALGIFVLGAICGAMGERWFIYHKMSPFSHMRGGPPNWSDGGRGGRDRGPGPSIRRMARDLELTPEQQEAISAIMESYRDRVETERREIGEKMRNSINEIRAKIRAELTEEQQVKFDQMEQDFRKRRGSRGGRGGRGDRGDRDGWRPPPPPDATP